jgi:hypothetical protein
LTMPEEIHWGLSMLSWIRRHWIWSGAVLIFLSAPLVVIAVRSLTAPTPELDPEGQWARAIERYGISPVFPPEEDFAVGDLFVQIVSDDDPDPNADSDRVSSSTAFRGRSVKLDHIDVRKELEAIYAMLPFFGDLVSGSASGSNQAEHGLFRRERKALPIAAFPGIALSDTQRAVGGLAWMGRHLFNFGAVSENSERLELPSIETYGLPNVVAQAMLEDYCTKTKDVCSERTARKYLRPIVGDRVFAEYTDKRDPTLFYYPIKIRIFMVNRVYLTRAIVNQVRFGRAEAGSAQLSGGTTSAEPLPQSPAPTGGVAGDPPGSLAELQKRIDDLEKRLSGSRQAAAGTYGSSLNRQLGIDQTFARPVAIGYRYVSYYEPDSSKP